jgi:hypothetical protein
VNCLGFGSNIRQVVLDELARESDGHFLFILSPDTVATNIVNSAATIGAAIFATPALLSCVGPGLAGGEAIPLSRWACSPAARACPF